MPVKVVINVGHAGRHYVGRPALLAAADAAIRRAVAADAAAYATPGRRFPRRLTVEGVTIEYRPFVADDGTVHVGTHFPTDQADS